MIALPLSINVGEHVLQGLLVNAPEPEHHSTEWLADHLHQHHRSDLSVANFVIVRPPVDQVMQEYDFRMRVFPSLRQRIPSLPVYLLGSQNFVHFITANLNHLTNDVFGGSRPYDLIAEVRQQELEFYARHSNALMRTTGNRYFRAPSSKYCQHFMRVGNIQTSRHAIDAIFFWLLPWLKDCSAIIAESWTVSSTALNAARLLNRYHPHANTRCRVDMLASYHDDSQTLREQAEDILRRVMPKASDRVMLLVSSCMSGNLVRKFKTTVQRAGFADDRCRCGAIFSLNKEQPVPSLCDATRLVPEGGFQFHDSLPEGGAVIEIDRRTYFPLRIEENTALIKKEGAATFKSFFDTYRSTNLFCVHRNCYDLNGQALRHHAIDLEVGEILSIEPFASQFRASVSKIEPAPKLIIVPSHRTGVQMAEIARGIFAAKGSEVRVLKHPDLLLATSDPVRAELQSMQNDESVLIIDDVSVTGRRLSTFAQSLRVIGFRGRIHFRVGIARPQSLARWNAVRRQLANRVTLPSHSVEEIHLVILPDWDRDECPWCAELALYRNALRRNGSIHVELRNRMQLLTVDEFSPAVSEGLFLHGSAESPLGLARDSIFIDEGATQAALFASVASLLQRMRTAEAQPEIPPPNYPEVTVLDTENYLGTRFPESSIRAAIMRAALTSELERPRDSDETSRAALASEVVFGGAQSTDLTLEILVAAAFGKLPALRLDESKREALRARYGETAEFFLANRP